MSNMTGHEWRALLAAHALQGMLASAPIADRTKINKAKWAKVAFEWADAMLVESFKKRRSKP